jgi:hypothetical protein
LQLYAHIAQRHRRAKKPAGAGVIVVARHENLAAGVYALLKTGLVNTLILSHNCASTVEKLMNEPERVINSVPPIYRD